MEVSVTIDTQASLELSGNSESVTTTNIQAQFSSEDLSMSDLKMCLNEFVNAEDIGISAANNSKHDVVMEDDCKDSDESNDNLPKSTSCVDGLLFEEKAREDFKTSEANGCNKSDKCHSPSISSVAPYKPASAMKGSREKQGILPKKLAVTWAPDVYDPIPTSVSHVPSSKNQYRNYGRKYGKNKTKGGGKRGGKGKDRDKDKDKKQGKKGGNTSKSKPVQDDSAASFSEPKTSIVDFNVVGTDPFCGSSFLKESVTNLHFPVAEAS